MTTQYTHSRHPSTASIESTTTYFPGTRSRRTSFTTDPFGPPHDTPLLTLPTSSAGLGGVARMVAQWESAGERRASGASASTTASASFSRRLSTQFTGGGSGSSYSGDAPPPRPASSLGFTPTTSNSTSTARTIQFAVNTTLTGTRSRTTSTTNNLTGSTTRTRTVSFSDAANRTHTHIHSHIYSGNSGCRPVARTVHATGVGLDDESLSKRRPVSWDVRGTQAWTAVAAAAGLAWTKTHSAEGQHSATSSVTTSIRNPKTSSTITPKDSTMAHDLTPRPLSRTGLVTARHARPAAPPSSYRSRVAPAPPTERTQDGQRSRFVSRLGHHDDADQSAEGQRGRPASRLGHRDDTEAMAELDKLTASRPRTSPPPRQYSMASAFATKRNGGLRVSGTTPVRFPGVAGAFGSPSTPVGTPSRAARAGRGVVVATPTPAVVRGQLPTPPVSTGASPPSTTSPDTSFSSPIASTQETTPSHGPGWTAIEAALRLRGTVPDGVRWIVIRGSG